MNMLIPVHTDKAVDEDLKCTSLYMTAPVPATYDAIWLVHADRQLLPELGLRKDAGCSIGRPFDFLGQTL